MNRLKEIIDNIGMKKICLFAHYGLAIGCSLLYFLVCIICLFIPEDFGIEYLTKIYFMILAYCGIIVTLITIKSVIDDFQEMRKPDSKFDVIGFIIGVALFVTLGLIIACTISMYIKPMTEIEADMWKYNIKIFGWMFGGEAIGGYVYNIFKKFTEVKKIDNEQTEEKEQQGEHYDTTGSNQ